MYKSGYMLSKFLCPISSVRGWMDVFTLQSNSTTIAMNEPSINKQFDDKLIVK
jgi:hypothetical protein